MVMTPFIQPFNFFPFVCLFVCEFSFELFFFIFVSLYVDDIRVLQLLHATKIFHINEVENSFFLQNNERLTLSLMNDELRLQIRLRRLFVPFNFQQM